MGEDDLSGTWVHPTGAKIEVARSGDGWQVGVFMFRRGKTPMGERLITDPEELQERIRKIEADGYVRAQPGEPGLPKAPMQPVQSVGVLLLVLGVLALIILIVVLRG